MSTRGHIAIKENVKYKFIYNHHDSYIDGLGITLYKYYKDVNKVKELIALGNTSSIGSIVEEGGSKTYREHLDKPLEQRGTVAFFRDINSINIQKFRINCNVKGCKRIFVLHYKACISILYCP